MTETEAREILGKWLQPDDWILGDDQYCRWGPEDRTACLDAEFTVDQLEAIAWWMRHKGQRND